MSRHAIVPASRRWTWRKRPRDTTEPPKEVGRLHDSAGEPLWPGFRRTATTDWLAPLEDGLRTLGGPDPATLVLAVLRGLLMDLDATGDAARTDGAFREFLRTLPTS